MPFGWPICPPSLNSSSLWRRASPAVMALAQGEFVSTCLASSSVHWGAGLVFQEGAAADSAAERQVKQPKNTRKLRIRHLARLNGIAGHFPTAGRKTRT